MSQWTVHELQGGLGPHAAAWDGLLQRLFQPNPMLDSRFVSALLRHFGKGNERLCVLQSNGEPKAMCVLQPRGAGLWASFLPSQAQIGPVLMNRPEAIGGLLSALPGFGGQLDFLCNDPLFGDLAGGEAIHHTSQHHALTMNIRLEGGFEKYWDERSKKLSQNIGRYERRSIAEGIASRFVCITAAQDIAAAVARYAALESRGWKGKIGTAVSLGSVQGAFYEDIASCFAQSGEACIYELWFDEQLVAARIAVVSGSTVVMLKTAYDESFDKYAPGRLLLRDTIRHAFATYPGGVIEFYTNANADQLAWATDQRWIMHVSYFRSIGAARLLALMQAGRRVFAGAAKSTSTGSLDTVAVYRHPREFPADVSRLFERAEKESIESGAAWYANLIDSVYPDHEGVRIYVLRRNEQAVAAIPVLVSKGLLHQRADALSNYYTAIYAPLLAPELKARELVPLIAEIRRQHAPLASLKFAPMDPQSAAFRKLQEAFKIAGLLPFEYFCFGNWYLKAGASWDDYLKSRSGTLRSTIKRMSKKFDADGGRLQLIQGGAELALGLRAYEEVYAASWKEPEPYASFIPGLVQACAERGWLRLGIAWLGDKPIAAQLWIVASGKASIYKVAYHEDYKAYTPGTLLTAMLMQHVQGPDGVSEVDYLIGDDPYKKTWMNDRRERWGLIVYNPRNLVGLFGLLRELGGRCVKSLQRRRKQPAE